MNQNRYKLSTANKINKENSVPCPAVSDSEKAIHAIKMIFADRHEKNNKVWQRVANTSNISESA